MSCKRCGRSTITRSDTEIVSGEGPLQGQSSLVGAPPWLTTRSLRVCRDQYLSWKPSLGRSQGSLCQNIVTSLVTSDMLVCRSGIHISRYILRNTAGARTLSTFGHPGRHEHHRVQICSDGPTDMRIRGVQICPDPDRPQAKPEWILFGQPNRRPTDLPAYFRGSFLNPKFPLFIPDHDHDA